MKWTSKVCVAGAATAFVVLCSHHSTNKQATQLKRRELSLFDPRSVNDKKPLSSSNGALLEFVHIPKTGGTAVEAAAWTQKQMIWGACHVGSMPNIGCDRPEWPHKFEWMGPSKLDRKYVGESWLAPPKWLHPNPYENKDTFCIIRNPYDRIVSEYHATTYSTFHSSKDPREMNNWIQMKLQEVMKMTTYPGFFLPQHFYVYDHHRRQAITHVLRYESLAQEFHGLMKTYNLNIELPQRPPPNESQSMFAKEFLSPDTITMINNLYGADFRIFGYPMVERPSQFAQHGSAAMARVPSKLDTKDLMGAEALNPNIADGIDDHEMAQQQAAMAGVHQSDNNNNGMDASVAALGQPQEVQVQIQTEPQQQVQPQQIQQLKMQQQQQPLQGQPQGEAISVSV